MIWKRITMTKVVPEYAQSVTKKQYLEVLLVEEEIAKTLDAECQKSQKSARLRWRIGLKAVIIRPLK